MLLSLLSISCFFPVSFCYFSFSLFCTDQVLILFGFISICLVLFSLVFLLHRFFSLFFFYFLPVVSSFSFYQLLHLLSFSVYFHWFFFRVFSSVVFFQFLIFPIIHLYPILSVSHLFLSYVSPFFSVHLCYVHRFQAFLSRLVSFFPLTLSTSFHDLFVDGCLSVFKS